jgi:hypothetical protein
MTTRYQFYLVNKNILDNLPPILSLAFALLDPFYWNPFDLDCLLRESLLNGERLFYHGMGWVYWCFAENVRLKLLSLPAVQSSLCLRLYQMPGSSCPFEASIIKRVNARSPPGTGCARLKPRRKMFIMQYNNLFKFLRLSVAVHQGWATLTD